MEGKKVLLVEDEQKVAEFIRKGFSENKIETDIAYDGFLGKRMFENNAYDLIILDINLPQINGYELCKIIRARNESVAILMLTAMGTTEDKLQGFDCGADDYLVKPFEFKELLARVKSLFRRAAGNLSADHILRLDDLEVNTDSKVVKRGGKKIELTNKEYQLLVFLLQNQGKVLSRSEIAEKIWDITFERGTNVIDVYVNFLRKKIDKDFPAKLIHTQIGMGYVMKSGGE